MTATTAHPWVLPLTAAAQFVLALDFSIVNVALATIQHELGFSTPDLQWVATGYALTFGALLLAGGRLGDRIGYRRALVIGLIIFAAASLAGGLAPTALTLVIARFFQGAGAAMVAPAALALLNHAYDDVTARARAISLFQGSNALGASAGIVLGGILTGLFGWRWVLLVNIPIVAVLVLLILLRLPRFVGNPTVRLDAATALAITAAVGLTILAVTEGQEHGFTSAWFLIPVIGALTASVWFVVRERRKDSDPMIPPALFLEARGGYLAVTAILGAVLGGYVYFIALYLQESLHLGPLTTGFALLPATGTAFIVATQIARRILPRIGATWQLSIAFVLMGAGQICLSLLDDSSSYIGGVVPGIILTASGIGLALPAAASAMTSTVTPAQRGVAGGLFTTGQQTGSAIGLAVLATIAASVTDSYSAVFITTSILTLIALATLAHIAVRHHIRRTRPGAA